jgi:hypothetical protein
MLRDAVFDDSGRYRYSLTRIWALDGPLAVFVMLNPSTADAERDDPTIRRCVGLARSWGYGRLEVVNLFAYRTHDPRVLASATEPEGPENATYVSAATQRADLIVAGWGNAGARLGADRAICSRLDRAHCLGLTRLGQPRHPLYVPRDTQPVPWLPVP